MNSKRKNTKQALFSSVLALILCISMLLGTTYAWFTDTVTSSGNKIKSGSLKLDLLVLNEVINEDGTTQNEWVSIKDNPQPLFTYENWEPGYTDVTILKVENLGTLALKWEARFASEQPLSALAEVIDVYVNPGVEEKYPNDRANLKAEGWDNVGTLNNFINTISETTYGYLDAKESATLGIALKMREDAGNEYQNLTLGEFDIRIVATQATAESDSFGDDYDVDAEYPVFANQIKKLPAGADAIGFDLSYKNEIIATLNVPAGAIADVTKPVSVTFSDIDPTETIVVGENIKAFAYDIEVSNLKENLSEDQLITVTLKMPNALPAAQVYHKGELINDAVYDEVEGTITFKTASFSPYAVTWKERTASTIEELRDCITGDDDVYIRLTGDIVIDSNEGTADFNGSEQHMAVSSSYRYYNGVNISGRNVTVDLNGNNIVASGNVGAIFFVMPGSSLNIVDKEGGGVVTAKTSCYVVWAPYDEPSFCDIYSGIFVAHSYADMEEYTHRAIVYAGEGGTINAYGGYYLYDNESYTDKNGVVHENVNNGVFNVMDSTKTKRITIYDGVTLINQYYRQDGYNANNKNADHDSIFLADNCSLVKISKEVTIDGETYKTWYQVQTSNPTKFETVFENTDKYIYRVGNQNTVALGSLFKTENTIVADTEVKVTITALNNAGVSYNYVANTSDWSKGTLQFEGTGVVEITIGECKLIVEVVDATNVISLSGTISGNVVLLNDCGISSLTVSGRNTVYGNGFTATYAGNGQYLNNGLKQGVINVSENGTLDNLRVVAPIYPRAYLYYGSTLLGDYVQGGPSEVDGKDPTKTRYFYQLSAVALSGNGTVSNCYIYGGRNNIFVNAGDVTIKDTILECGTVANIQIQSNSSHTITIENLTTIQYQVNPTVWGKDTEADDRAKVMLGAGILVGPETTENPSIVLNGAFKQYNWVNADDQSAVSDKVAQTIIGAALDATAYNHTINGKTASNLGIIYMNTYNASVINNTDLPYAMGKVTLKANLASIDGNVYSVSNATSEKIFSDYENADRTTVNGLYKPQFKYDSNLGGQYIEKTDDGDEFLYREGDTIYVMFPSGDTKEIDLATLVNIVKYTGQNLNLNITVKHENGNSIPVTNGKVALSTAGEYTVTYTVTDTLFFDKDGKQVTDTKNYSWNTDISVALKDTAIPNAYFEFDATKQVIYRSGNSNIKQFIPFLAGLKIYDYNGQTSYLRFDGDNDFNKIAKASINNINTTAEAQGYHIVTIEFIDGGKLVIDMDVRANSGSSTHTGSIKVRNNVLYVVNGGTTSGKGQTWKIYSYKFVGNNGTEINSGLVTFGTAGVDCDTATTPSSNFGTTVKYTVTYDANEGSCGQNTGYATSVSAAVTLPTPTRSGYIFAGWYTAAEGGTRVGGAGESYTPSANVTLYAQWGKPCTVTYNANGGSCGTASEKYTGTALTLPAPARDGYWFIGWYDAANGGNKIGDAGETYNPKGEITLYAHWQEAIKYTVTYNANGGTCGTASATYEGTALTLPTPTRTGYKFLGWYDAASGGTKIGDAGETYIPEANITLYAQWEKIQYKITVSTNNATVSGVTNEQTAYYGDTITFTVTYSESESQTTTVKDANGNTVAITGSYTFTMPASNVTINASSSAPSCVTPDTLITLADGTQVRVDSLKGDEMLLVWNMETGKLDAAPIMFVDSDPTAEYEIIKLKFSDGTEVKVIYEHGFWDYDLNKYVYLDRYAEKYIGHTFAKQNGDKLEKVQLTDVVIETKITTAWSPVTVGHLCYFVNGMLSMPGGVGGLFNIFEVDAETMTYDYEQLAKDIETYGLFTYEELNAICPLTEDMFNAAGGAYLKISIGKGNLTIDELINMINRYSKFI